MKLRKGTLVVVVSAALAISASAFAMGKARSKSLSESQDQDSLALNGNATSSDAGNTVESASSDSAPSAPSDGHACGRLAENGSTIMKPTLGYFDDTAAGAYLLNRKPSINGVDQYEIVLNYQFSPPNPAINDFVNKCFARMSQYLIGPNGEQITIRLPQPGDAEVPAAHVVEVGAGCGGRGEALCWTPEYTCPEILHETMHHLGLVDEYHDIEMNFSCRSLGPEDSLMTDYHKADQAVEPVFRAASYRCDIFSGSDQEKCIHALDLIQSGMKFTSTPTAASGYTVTFENGEILPLEQQNDDIPVAQDHEILDSALVPAGTGIAYTHNGFNIPDETIESLSAAAKQYASPNRVSQTLLTEMQVLPGKRKPILYPAEASTILYGKCSANSTFLSCEHGAYSNHFCSSKPAVCPSEGQTREFQGSAAWLNMPEGVNP